jgi:rhamnopyranosyl-N-acetylglucosaminyl-diphospho-decaprenol beta-1,3/1,4-galactofuranosyltransferase
MARNDSSQAPKIAVVIVTHNRLALLQQCLTAVRGLTRKADEIIVVNNASADGTSEWLRTQSGLTVIEQGDVGSAGGFRSGIKHAYEHQHDWIWCMDDDSLPTPRALEAFTQCPYFDSSRTGFLASVVVWKDGSPHFAALTNPVNVQEWLGRVLEDRSLGVRSASWVGVMISRTAIARVGLPIKEFYIYCEDIEYTLRISAQFPGYVVLDSKMIHQTEKNIGSDPTGISTDRHASKTRYYYRNNVTTILLAPASLVRRLKRVMVFVTERVFHAKSWAWRFTILQCSLAGVWLYLKLRKANFHV